MADFEVKKKPEFSSTARKLETTDRAHADLFNDLYQKMFDNDNYLKQNVESKAEKDGGEASKTLWGKMKKFVEDFKAWCTGVCLIGHIVNNCTSTANNLPLAAAQGKALMDLYTQLYSDLSTAINGVITLQSGTYTPISNWYPEGFDVNLIARVESGGVSIAGTITTKINFASGDYNLFGLGDYPHGRGAFNDHNIISAASLSHAMIFPYKDDTRYFLIRLFDGVGPGTEFYVCGKALFV